MDKKIEKIFLDKTATIKDALKKMNEGLMGIVLVVDNNQKLIGTIVDGDIRRAILDNKKMDSSVLGIMNKNPKYLYSWERGKEEELMLKKQIVQIPILNKQRKVIDIILWKELKEKKKRYTCKKNIIFIPAGGKGERLDPFTKVLPKPLIPFRDKPMIEEIMERFHKYGFRKFVLTLNYKAEMIKAYFADNHGRFNINFHNEQMRLGTAGSLYFLKKKVSQPIIISNCDVLIDLDFHELLKHHKKNRNDITIVSALKHVKIPYGVIEMNDGNLLNIMEKPEYDFMVNAGIYVIEPKILDYVSKDKYIDMPELIKLSKNDGFKISVYPYFNNWSDVGEWDEYKKACDNFKNPDMLLK
ncbi:MAG: hypothetical protein ACD_79C01302G0008 [uncultured bacterium]|nr:MAG: hypothetical protein ACD_79C01302G0008 [uncultured bacterium]